jgi:poly-beta-1,6-N-acetyl-D-glucosamine biosynthesis protein PgaD
MSDPYANWPPIITHARHGRFVDLRDTILTLLMWGLLGLILYTEMRFAWESLMVLLGRSDAQIDAELALFWRRMQPLLWLMGALVVMLAVATILSRRRREEAIAGRQPEPLAEEAVAALAGLSMTELQTARSHRIAVVHRTADGSLRVEAKAAKAPEA